MSNFDHVHGVVSQTNRTHNPHANSLAYYPLDYQGTYFFHIFWKVVLISCYHIHTYIIGHYNPSVRIIDLVSHTTYVVCVNFIHKWRDLLFKVDSERQIFFFEKLFMAILFTLRVFARNLLRGNRRRNTFRILF